MLCREAWHAQLADPLLADVAAALDLPSLGSPPHFAAVAAEYVDAFSAALLPLLRARLQSAMLTGIGAVVSTLLRRHTHPGMPALLRLLLHPPPNQRFAGDAELAEAFTHMVAGTLCHAWLAAACTLGTAERRTIADAVQVELEARFSGGWAAWVGLQGAPDRAQVLDACTGVAMPLLRSRDVPTQRYSDARQELCTRFRGHLAAEQDRISALRAPLDE